MLFMFGHHRPARLSRQVLAAIVVLGIVLLVVSCATTDSAGTPTSLLSKVWLTNQKSVSILPLSTLTIPLEFSHQMEGSYQKQVFYMDVLMTADAQSFLLLAFNSFGTQIFELAYDKLGVRYTTSLPIGQMKPEYLIADFQIAFYPIAAVRTMLEQAGLRFVVSEDSGKIIRRVYDGDNLVIEARLGTDQSEYHNILRGYAYIFR